MDKLFKNFINFAMGNVLVILLGLISTPLITNLISKVPYAKGNMFTTVTSLFILVAMMGMDQSYIRYFNEEEEENRGALLGKCLSIALGFSLIIGVISLLLYKPISIFTIEEESFKLTLLIIIHSIFSIIGNISLIHIRMKQKGKTYSFLTVVNKVAYIGFILLIYIYYENHYMTIILATILSNIIKLIWSIYIEKEDWKVVFNITKAKTTTNELIRYGLPFVFSMSMIWVFQSIDKVSLRQQSTYEEIALYTAAMTIIALLNNVQGAFQTFWTPVAFDKFANHPEDKEFFININEIVSVIMLILSVLLIACKDILILLLAKDFRDAKFVFPFLVLMPIMYTISETTVLGINFNKKTKYHVYIATISAIANVIGNTILVPYLGARGAAISTGLSYVVFFITRTYFSNKLFKVEFKLRKFWVCITSVYILATYSSMHSFNIIILIMSLLSLSLTIILYKKSIINTVASFKRKK